MKNKIQYNKGTQTIIIDLTKSAPIQIKPFPGIESLCQYWREKGYKQIVDVGCGKLRNSLVLVKYFKLWTCDYPEVLIGKTVENRYSKLVKYKNYMGHISPEEFKKGMLNVDAAMLVFVLHTLPEERLRIQLIKSTIKNTRYPHQIFISVPNGEKYYRRRMKNENKIYDGHFYRALTEVKTFYREYSANEIDLFMNKLGFKVDRIFTVDKKNLSWFSVKWTFRSKKLVV